MKTKLLYISIISLLFIIQACKRNESPCSKYTSKSYKFLLADSTKAQIPYTGNETLMFISNLGDTAILTGQGKNDYILNSTVNVGNDPACPKYDDYSFEREEYHYRSNDDAITEITLTINISKDKFVNFNIIVNGSNSGIYLNEQNNHTDSILLNNKYYSGYYLYGSNKILYNENIGVLSISINNGKIWKIKL